MSNSIIDCTILTDTRLNTQRTSLSNIFLHETTWSQWCACLKRCHCHCQCFGQRLIANCAPLAWLLNIVKRLEPMMLGMCNFMNLTPTVDELARHSETRDWLTAPIRYISFHPDSENLQMALLTNKDNVLIHTEQSTTPICLTHCEQQHVSCAAWRPWTQTTLAVGCAAGICLWHCTRQNKGGIRNMLMNGSYEMRQLQDEAHSFVASLQWSRQGTTLVSAALGTRYIVVWEPDRGVRLRLVDAVGNSCYRLLRYSPDCQLLFCGLNKEGASVWQITPEQWKEERFHMTQHIQTAAWTACGRYLLFAPQGSTLLYASTANAEAPVFVRPEPVWHTQLVLDLSCVTCLGQQEHCGEPQVIAVDPLNIYLAIIFKEQPFVLLCLMALTPRSPLRLLPLDYISNEAPSNSGYPTYMSFGRKRGCASRVLAIGWSTGHLQRHVLGAQCLEEAEQLINIKWGTVAKQQADTKKQLTVLYRSPSWESDIEELSDEPDEINRIGLC